MSSTPSRPYATASPTWWSLWYRNPLVFDTDMRCCCSMDLSLKFLSFLKLKILTWPMCVFAFGVCVCVCLLCLCACLPSASTAPVQQKRVKSLSICKVINSLFPLSSLPSILDHLLPWPGLLLLAVISDELVKLIYANLL